MPSNDDTRTKVKTDQQQETGPWDTALDQLRQWDPKWAETCVNMGSLLVAESRHPSSRKFHEQHCKTLLSESLS